MEVQISKDDLVERSTDDRGRINLGIEFANKNVQIAVLEVFDNGND